MTRQEYNFKILNIIHYSITEFQVITDDVLEYIRKYPDQRFGQIICNYVCPDYRSSFPSVFTKIFMNTIFPNNSDPFFEESKETYERVIEI